MTAIRVITILLTIWGAPAMAYETPFYKVLSKDGAFETRLYAPRLVAETTVTATGREALSQGFNILAAYIFGQNEGEKKVAMTAPVASASPATIEMTAPVASSQGEAGQTTIQFFLPKAYSLDTAPQPKNPNITLRMVPEEHLVVLRFSGSAGEEAFALKTKDLMDHLASKGIKAVGPVREFRYDPPWTLWFLRRNEVSIPVAPQKNALSKEQQIR